MIRPLQVKKHNFSLIITLYSLLSIHKIAFLTIKTHKHPTLVDNIYNLRKRKIKTTFFSQINTIKTIYPEKINRRPRKNLFYDSPKKSIL